MRLRLLVLSLLSACAFVFFACSSDDETHNGLALVIATNVKTPDDLDAVHLEVFQEKSSDLPPDASDRYLSTGTDYTFRVPDEQQLPGTFTISAGTAADQNAYIRITGLRKGKPIVLREIRIQIPTTRLAQYLVVLSNECVNRLVVDGAGRASAKCDEPLETCLPDSKEVDKCGSSVVDSTTLPDYDGKYQEIGTLPIVPIPEAGTETGPAPVSDASDDTSDSATPDAGPAAITAFEILGTGGQAIGAINEGAGTITVFLSTASDLKGLVTSIQINGASVMPASGTPQDFDQGPVSYTVVPVSGAPKTYKVSVMRALAPAPTVSPDASKVYVGTQNVTLTSSVVGAVIHYTVDGSTPTATSPTTQPIPISATTLLRFFVVATGYTDAQSQTTFTIAKVTLSPSAPFASNDILVTPSSVPADATICYQLDAAAACETGTSNCKAGSLAYGGTPVLLQSPGVGKSVTFHAVGCRADLQEFGTSLSYTWKVATPTFTPPAGSHLAAGGKVNIATTTDHGLGTMHAVVMYVTANGATPDCSGTTGQQYLGTSNDVTVPASAIIKAIACRDDYAASDVVTASFTP